MNMSTIVMPCNMSGLMVGDAPATGQGWGIVDVDW
jgi:hypothetical protein